MSETIARVALGGDDAGFVTALQEASASSGVRVIVVDIAAEFGHGDELSTNALDRGAELARVCGAMFDCSLPVLARAEGRLAGWALTAAAAADLLVVTRSTVFGAEVGGDPTATGGPLAYLLPPRMAKWLALGAGDISAGEAWEAGFVNRVAADGGLDSAVDELAARIALVPADVLAAKKAAHVYDMEVEGFRSVLAATAEFHALASAR